MHNGPHSIGIILDGNRRWAKLEGKTSFEGHYRGFEKVKELLDWALEAGVREVTLYAFSTENWNRSKEEVTYLMELFEKAFPDYLDKVMEKNMQLRFLGQRNKMSATLQKLMNEAEEKSKGATGGILAIAVSYGGRSEILEAVNTLLAEGYDQVTEEELREKMWSNGMSDPDLIIRTSGEQRLSNFLTWGSVYSELFFTKTFWPAFSKEEFLSILEEYRERERRHGK